ncbi:glycosyltransferase family 2 protein [Legionella fallonii]|uniref:Putative glycosyltransferases n=1 Tax=Legionella fallonii LLAP-10 TaxID=1212491 RepID=A0A098GA47_9GAMM|nr:glycosyltransferase family 2 protein [Legionella fallonii]CEG58360.1 putative glycosyltransferases [Legionella fallonii LLAP-10]
MKLSIVATLYKSDPFIDEFYQRASHVAQQFANHDYEIIFVNDGSPDKSLERAVQLSEHDNHIVVVDLSRNFGHHKAMRAGLECSTGDYVFLIDSDLEEEPEWLIPFSEQMSAEQSDVVYGVQENRKGNWFERWSGSIYYVLLNWLISIEHPKNITTARLMSRRYVTALLSHKEIESVISCLWVITGFNQCAHIVKKHTKSTTTYGFFKKINHMINAVTSFSAAPLHMIFLCGIFIFLGTVVYTSTLIIDRVFMATPLNGWTSIMVSIWLLGGIIISFIGIIGIYLAKIFSETKQRPYVIIRKIYGKSDRGY